MNPLPLVCCLLGSSLLAVGALVPGPVAARGTCFALGASGIAMSAFFLARAAGLRAEDALARSPAPLRFFLRLLVLPYAAIGGTILVLRRLSSREPCFDEVGQGLFVGALPLPWERRRVRDAGIAAVLNLCFEFPPAAGRARYRPMLDGVPPHPLYLAEAVTWIVERRRAGERVLIHCAQGHGRSACTAAAALLALGEVPSIEAAFARLRAARPGVCLREGHRTVLEAWWRRASVPLHGSR